MSFVKPVVKPLARVGTFGLVGLAASKKKKSPLDTTTPASPPTMIGESGRSLIDIGPRKSVY